MSDKYFIDTNVLVYSFNLNDHYKRRISLDLISNALNNHSGCISYQVVQEFLNVATRKFVNPLSTPDCRVYLNAVLEPLCHVYASGGLYYQALEIAERWRYSFYDSLIISSAIIAECSLLYTEDLQHEQRIQDLTIINPFL
ncbi:MAG: PIN domain-containing protein [Candidatus Dadabacteria bacterium]|nr:MAG: PIN domain-containing protein [Candidatus Dadabacteria bacterium]